MATNVLELHRDRLLPPGRKLIEAVSIATREEIADAAATLALAARREGLRITAWHDLATFEPMVDAEGDPLNTGAFGWREQDLAAWQCRDRMLRSPLVRALRVESDTFWANRHGIHTRLDNRVIGQIACTDVEAETCAKAAILVPVHQAFGQVGGAILTSFDPGVEDLSSACARVAETLAPAIARFVRGYVMVSRDERYLPDDCMLTSREIDCLNWIALGKTDFEIGIILGCSHAGVRYHVTRACAKLGAVNRAQSVFRAAQLGLLGSPCASGSR